MEFFVVKKMNLEKFISSHAFFKLKFPLLHCQNRFSVASKSTSIQNPVTYSLVKFAQANFKKKKQNSLQKP